MIRTCIGCRRRTDPAQLLHFVRRGQQVVPDPGRDMGGRGAWAHVDCVEQATARRAWARALRIPGAPDLSLLTAGA